MPCNIIDYHDQLDISKLPNKSKIRFICSDCGKEYITCVLNFSKPICPSCKKKITAKTIDWSIRNMKTKQTKLYKYGDPNYVNVKLIKKTKLERYGDINYNNIDKAVLTNLEKYGVKYSWQAESIKEKIKNSIDEKYGEDRQLIFDKIKATNNKIYGCDWGFQSEYVKQKIVNTCLKKYNLTNGGGTQQAHQKMHKKYEYNNLTFDSSWEVALYIYLTDANVKFEYQPNIGFEYYLNDKKHIYYPDFKINDDLVEIKGDHFFENNCMINPFNRAEDELYNEKYKCMLKNNIKILKYSDIAKYIDYVINIYGADYLNKFRK